MEARGYTNTIAKLTEQYDQGRLAHTLLIHGRPGWGTLSCALDLATHILAKPAEDGLFGPAPAPVKTGWTLEHPDLHISFPFINTKSQGGSISDDFIVTWKDFVKRNVYWSDLDWFHYLSSHISGDRKNPTGNINRAECANILRKLSLKSFGNNAKVLIIWFPEYLAKEGNRLLKTLEEPSDDTFIILVASSTQKILGTILSRCQSVQMKPWIDTDISAAIAEKYPQMSDALLVDVVRRSQGDIGRALHLCDSVEDIDTGQVLTWLRLCYQCNIEKLFKFSEDFARQSRDNQVQWLEYALFFVQQINRYLLDPSYQLLMEEKEAIAAQKMSKVISLKAIDRMASLLEDSIRQIRGNASAKILMTDVSLLFHEVLKTGDVPQYAYID